MIVETDANVASIEKIVDAVEQSSHGYTREKVE
jgi:hypothetical protein